MRLGHLALPLALLAVCAGTDARHRRRRGAPHPAAERCENPSIHVDKSDGVLDLYCGAQRARRFIVTFGANPVGPKVREGDERTPEGTYRLVSHGRTRRFHRFMGISYPNEADLHRARQLGVDRPGFGVGIHGSRGERAWLMRMWIPFAHQFGLIQRWGPTDGCIALSNDDVEELYRHVDVGTPVIISP
jgi:murein L,D-transpeptidase YafK